MKRLVKKHLYSEWILKLSNFTFIKVEENEV